MKAIVEYAFGTKENPIPELSSVACDWISPSWKQVHGIKVCEVKTSGQQCGEVDGFWTRKSEVPLSIVTADCVPILLYRNDSLAVGALHAGWRGVAQHIVREFFQALPEEFNDPRDWTAVLGPSIRECCYEFGSAELDRMRSEFPELKNEELSPAPRVLNLLAPIKNELNSLGVKIEKTIPECTFCAVDPSQSHRYFSYRRGDRNSRQFSVIQMSSLRQDVDV